MINFRYIRAYFVKIISKLIINPLFFAIIFFVLFSAISVILDLSILASRSQEALTNAKRRIENLIGEELVMKPYSILMDSVYQYCFVDTNIKITSLGINCQKPANITDNRIYGYVMVHPDSTDENKLSFGEDPQASEHYSKIPPYKIITTMKDTTGLTAAVLHTIRNEPFFYETYNKLTDGYNLVTDVYQYGTGENYLTYFECMLSNQNTAKAKKRYYNSIFFVISPIKNIVDSINSEYNVDFTITNMKGNGYLYGNDSLRNKILSYKNHSEIKANLHVNKGITIDIAPNKNNILQQMPLFPWIYLMLLVIAVLMYLGFRYLINQINLQNQALTNANYTKDKFFSIIAHDLRNPISAATNIAEVFTNYYQQMSNDQIYQSIKTLMKSINNVGDLLDNLMIWSQMNTNDILFAPSQYRLTEIIDDVLEDFGVYLKTKDITVDVDIKIDNSEVFCDADMIWRVIRNLISNAMKYSYEHSKVEITVMEWTNDDYLLVEVRDYGVGMFPEIMAKLFRIDERVALSGTLGEKGSGLGLILCKEFIDRHNGAIWCGSEIGKGSTFYFTLARKK